MSSSAFITFDKPVLKAQWEEFCQRAKIAYSECTVGGNVFYYGGFGGVEITFGQTDWGTHRDERRPPAEARQITCSSFFGSNLRTIAMVTQMAMAEFGGTWEASPEVKQYMTVPAASTMLKDELVIEVERLRAAIRNVVTQRADALCWRDAYTDLAGLVGIQFCPQLIADPEQFAANCKHFDTSLRTGGKYIPIFCEKKPI